MERENLVLRQENIIIRKKLELIIATATADLHLNPYSDANVPVLNAAADGYSENPNNALRAARSYIQLQQQERYLVFYRQRHGLPELHRGYF